jgi:hypothetical protein
MNINGHNLQHTRKDKIRDLTMTHKIARRALPFRPALALLPSQERCPPLRRSCSMGVSAPVTRGFTPYLLWTYLPRGLAWRAHGVGVTMGRAGTTVMLVLGSPRRRSQPSHCLSPQSSLWTRIPVIAPKRNKNKKL